MKVIKFPQKGPPRPGGRPVRVRQEPGNGLSVGKVNFTCVNCSNATTVDFRGMIFRTVDFYCAACGAFHRMTNPGFAPPNPPAKPKPSTRK